MKIVIGHLYPDLLNLYGDRGNILSLQKRLEWRGFEAEIIEFNINDTIEFDKLDIVFLGGGSDREQLLVCEKLCESKHEFKKYVENNGVVLGICGGYQLLGKYYKLGDKTINGLEILDIYTENEPGRLISNVVIKSNLIDNYITGFENHGGRTYINDHTPLGNAIYGGGNNGKDANEGVVYKNVIGTYLHGPLLPKNPKLCDYILLQALKNKGYNGNLAELDDKLENLANEYIVSRFCK